MIQHADRSQEAATGSFSSTSNATGHLVALLLNPPLRDPSDTVSMANLHVAKDVLGCASLQVANMFAIPTKDLPDINLVGREPHGWLATRPQLTEAIAQADVVILGWGLGGLSGPARLHFREQIDWVFSLLAAHGRVWTVGGVPRHPSRWRQFVGPQRNIARGEDFTERLRSVLQQTTRQATVGYRASHTSDADPEGRAVQDAELVARPL